MTLHATHCEPMRTDLPADARIVAAEMWLCMLGGLLEVARRFCRFLVHEMMPCGTGPKRPFLRFRYSGRPGAALKRVMRILRFAAVLHMRIQSQIAAWKAGEPFDLDAFLGQTPLARALSRCRQDAADDRDEDLDDWEDLDEVENLVERESQDRFDVLGGYDRPARQDKYEALLRGPLRDAIAAICKDLGIKPDWSLWTSNGFPAPQDGTLEDWVVFFVPEAAAPAPRPDNPWSLAPRSLPVDEAGARIWPRRWERHERPPPYGPVTGSRDRGGSP